jgi:hypothetical protein
MGVAEQIASFDMGHMLDELMKNAKQQRSKIPYSHDETFPITVIVLGPNLEVGTMPMTWSDNREKYLKMKAVSAAAKEMNAHAVTLITDTRWTESDDFAAHFKIPDAEARKLHIEADDLELPEEKRIEKKYPHDQLQLRYATDKQAAAGHARLKLQCLIPPRWRRFLLHTIGGDATWA